MWIAIGETERDCLIRYDYRLSFCLIVWFGELAYYVFILSLVSNASDDRYLRVFREAIIYPRSKTQRIGSTPGRDLDPLMLACVA